MSDHVPDRAPDRAANAHDVTAAGEKTPEQLEAEIALQRERLAGTVDQLAAKLDVKAQAQQRMASLRVAATTGTCQPRTEVLAAAGSLVAMAVVLLLWRRRGHR